MATSYASFLALLLIFLSVFWNFNACNASSQGGFGFSMTLIHRDSPRSPHYQPSLTNEDRVRAMIDRSISRAHYISSIISGTSDSDSDVYSGGGGVYTSIASSPSGAPSSAPSSAPGPSSVHSKVIPNNGDYLMELEIGTPPVKIVAIADTGSDLVWIQCEPCDQCYNQTDPIFDPSKSSSFDGSVSCEDDICLGLPTATCDDDHCAYGYTYGDGSGTSGTLARETFTFSSGTEKKVNAPSPSIPGIVFGCSHDSAGTFDANEDGLIGLGGGNASLVRQLDPSIHGKFSYCLVPYPENTTSALNFGDNAVVSGPGLVTIPMYYQDFTFYSITLQSITVGSDAIPDIPDTDIIVDSGTTLTYISNSTLSKVIDDLSKKVNLTRTNDPHKYFALCYSHSVNAPPYPFPDITFTFKKPPHDQVPLLLTPTQTFIHVSDDVICLAMHAAFDGDVFILGNVAQQNMHVGYDLQNNLLSFAPANCSEF
ncbi:putative nepenthesin [Dioscorea sansibarensis]